jgi:hypothetical protein
MTLRLKEEMETCVWQALRDVLAPLLDFGFTFERHPRGVTITAHGQSKSITARELIGADDPCGYIAEVFGL